MGTLVPKQLIYNYGKSVHGFLDKFRRRDLTIRNSTGFAYLFNSKLFHRQLILNNVYRHTIDVKVSIKSSAQDTIECLFSWKKSIRYMV